MKIERADWLVADGELRGQARGWWRVSLAGLGLEAALGAFLLMASRVPGWAGGLATAAIMARAICGSIGAWLWLQAANPPEFWGFQAKWAMQFLPSSLLAWRRRAWLSAFIHRLAPADLGRRVELAGEQLAFYAKGASAAPLGSHRREMAGWASAARECHAQWKARSEAERLKSPAEREEALRELGLGRCEVKESMIDLERLEVSKSAGLGAMARPPRRL